MYNDINDQIIVKSICFISLGVRITIHVLVDTHAQWQKKWASSHTPHSLITWKLFSYWMAWYTLNTNNNLIKSITHEKSWSDKKNPANMHINSFVNHKIQKGQAKISRKMIESLFPRIIHLYKHCVLYTYKVYTKSLQWLKRSWATNCSILSIQ